MWRLHPDVLEQLWEKTKLGIIRQADSKGVVTRRRIKLPGPANGTGDCIHGWLQFFQNRQSTRGWLEYSTVTDQ
ncbi:hypothetical protein D3C80_825230 [compost metagenome]